MSYWPDHGRILLVACRVDVPPSRSSLRAACSSTSRKPSPRGDRSKSLSS